MNFYNVSLLERDQLEEELTLSEFRTLAKTMHMIEARKVLQSMEASSHHAYSKEDQKKNHKKWYKIGYPDNFRDQKIIKTTDLGKALGLG